jgi:hypothetical protein
MRKCFAIAALCWAAPVYAAQEPAEFDKTTLRELVDEVRQLRARVQELEARLPTATPEKHDLPVPASAIPDPELAVQADSASASPRASHSFLSSPLLNFHGYGDLGYRAAGGTSTFTVGQADLFLTSKLSDNLSFLMETVIDFNRNNVPGIDIERIFLTYRANEYLNIDAGRYHTAIGYYGTAFHHGRWFETAVDRPFLFAFEDDGGLLPIYNVGASISGRIPSGPLGLNYVAEIGNGRSYKSGSEPVQTTTDDNNGKSTNLALSATPHALPGWQFGGSAYRDRLTPEAGARIGQNIFSLYAVYVRDRVEFLNEGVLMHHNQAGRVTTVPAFYTQFSYRIGAASRPYFRFEYMNAAASDPVVSPEMGKLGYRRSVTAGYRYELTEFCALKFQMERVRRRDLATVTEGSVQLAFVF